MSCTATPVPSCEEPITIGQYTPMKLCENCRNIKMPFQKLSVQYYQPSYTAMLSSASNGCDLCTLVSEAARILSCRRNHCTVDQAHERLCSQSNTTRRKCKLRGMFVPLGYSGSPLDPINRKIAHGEVWSPLDRIVFSIPDAEETYTEVSWHVRVIPDASKDEEAGIARREITPYANFEHARGWIRQCIRNHPTCSSDKRDTMQILSRQSDVPPEYLQSSSAVKPEASVLPTRVIDVGSGDGSREPRLVLSKGKRGEYVALSHCWGASKPLVTETSNLMLRLQGIPMATLPPGFYDAVIATRRLGYQFLWIDSLCILQDSPKDWEQECAKMSSVYQNAILTISGMAAPDSSSSFLQERLSKDREPLVWEYKDTRDGALRRITLRKQHDGREESSQSFWDKSMKVDESHPPIARRGWILQERLLSPRILYFGRYRMFWECNTQSQFEDVCYNGYRLNFPWGAESDKRLFSRALVQGPNPSRGAEDVWYRLVKEYSSRFLTYSTDTLPALSGLASLLCSGRGYEYFAGLLKHDLHRGLAWYVCSDAKRLLVHNNQRNNLVPSWSWASNDYSVFFRCILPQPEYSGLDFKRAEELKRARRKAGLKLSRNIRIHVVHAEVTVPGHDPFGQVTTGYLRVEGRVVPANNELLFWQASDWYLERALYLDDPEETPEFGAKVKENGLFLAVDAFGFGWDALLILPVPGQPNNYRRVGYGIKWDRGATHIIWRVEDCPFYNAPKQQLILV